MGAVIFKRQAAMPSGASNIAIIASWRAFRDETKFDRLTAFAAALPRLRARTAADMARSGLPRTKVLATVVRLLEKSFIRVGNEEYARDNRSFGLTTLRDGHVRVRGSQRALRVPREERHSPFGGRERSATRASREAVPGSSRA